LNLRLPPKVLLKGAIAGASSKSKKYFRHPGKKKDIAIASRHNFSKAAG
jgi:hypothetical protein